MNLTPYREYHESDVIQLFALSGATGQKGNIVSIVPVAGVATGDNPINRDGFGPQMIGVVANTYSARYETKARVAPTASGAIPLGLQLYDVLEVNPYNESLLYRSIEKAERQAVLSGQTVPIVTRGVFGVQGASGLIYGGSVGVARNGTIWGVGTTVPAGETAIGQFLGTTGRAGEVIFKLSI